MLRDSYREIRENIKKNVVLLGISVDDIYTQERYKEELGLPYELLSDSEKTVSRAYGVLNSSGTFSQRRTFIIDPKGIIAHVFHKVDVSRHNQEIKEVLEKLDAGY